METPYTASEIIAFGQRLADAGYICRYEPRSHSHKVWSLFPQTLAQYKWLRQNCGTTSNLVIIHTAEEVAAVVPELKDYIRPTKSGRFCRIDIWL